MSSSLAAAQIEPTDSTVDYRISMSDGFSGDVSMTVKLSIDHPSNSIHVPLLPGVASIYGPIPVTFEVQDISSSVPVMKADVSIVPSERPGIFGDSYLPRLNLSFRSSIEGKEKIELKYIVKERYYLTKEAGLLQFSRLCTQRQVRRIKVLGYNLVSTAVNRKEVEGNNDCDHRENYEEILYYSIFDGREQFYRSLSGSISEQVDELRNNPAVMTEIEHMVQDLPRMEKLRVLIKWIAKDLSYYVRGDFYPQSVMTMLKNRQVDDKGHAVLLVVLARTLGMNVDLVLASSYSSSIDFDGYSVPITANRWMAYDADDKKIIDFALIRKDSFYSGSLAGLKGQLLRSDGSYRDFEIDNS